MLKRSAKNNHTITTYSCNNGCITEIYDKYGRSIKCKFDFTEAEALRTHQNFIYSL